MRRIAEADTIQKTGDASAARVVVRGAKRWRLPVAALRRAVATALGRAAPRVVGDVTVVLTNDRSIRRLNRTFRGKDRPTDVLSFDIGEGTVAGEPFGDIVVSVETIRTECQSLSFLKPPLSLGVQIGDGGEHALPYVFERAFLIPRRSC